MKKKRFSEEQIVRILRQAEEAERTATEVCKEHGVSQQTFYRWKKKLGQMDVPIEKDDSKVIERLKAISKARPREGAHKAYKKLRREGFAVNHKKVERLWHENGLTVRPKRRRRKFQRQTP